jgi:hypothetical protein
MNIRHLETKNTSISSQTINGFSVKAFLNANAFANGDTQYGSSRLDFSKVAIKAVLNRNGQEHILFQDNLKIIGLASNLNKRGQLAFYQDHDHYTKLGDGKSLVSFNIELGGCIRLSGDDYIYLEVSNQDGVFNDAYLTNSFIEVKALKAVGYELYIPSIRSQPIQANESSNVYSIGDNVIRAVILNYDQPDLLNPVIANLNFASDRYNEGLTFADLVLLKEASFPKLPVNLSTDPATIFESDQSFTLIDMGKDKFNQVIFSLQFNSANVNASKNYVVWWSFKTDWTTIQKASELQATHIASDQASVPAMSSK